MTSRREFLTRVSSMLAVPAALSLTGCAEQVDDPTMAADTTASRAAFDQPVGVQLYSVRNELADDLEGTLRAVKAAGFNTVETYSYHDMTPADFRSVLDDVGLDVQSMHMSYERAVNETDAVAEEAQAIGSGWVVVPWIPHEGTFSSDVMNQAIDDFSRAGQVYRDAGLRFAYHAHGYEFHSASEGGTLFDRFMQETEMGVVDVQMDVFWVVWPGQDPVALLEAYPGRFPSVHIKDMRSDVTEGDLTGSAPHEAQVPIGEGRIDYASILEVAEENGTELYFIEYEHTDPLQAIETSLQYLESLSA